MSEPPVTLALVSYNKADTVGLALDSVARGTRRPDLVVLSDDGSDDGTPDVAEAAAARLDLPCLVLRHPRVGVYRIQAMRNACVTHALEGLVVLSDSDCLFGERSIASHVAQHEGRAFAVASGPRYEFEAGTSGPFSSTTTTLEYAHFGQAMHSVPVGANLSFHKQTWRALGGFDRAFDGSYGMEEFEFNARVVRGGGSLHADPGAYVFHVPHDTVFGGRVPTRNVAVFDAKYRTDHHALENAFLRYHVVPHYWGGGRKRPVLGDAVALDAWGAPPGFQPPFHLGLSRSLAPLVALVRGALRGRTGRQRLRDCVYGIDNLWLASGSPALAAMQRLQHALTFRPRLRDAALRDWLEAAPLFEPTAGAVHAR